MGLNFLTLTFPMALTLYVPYFVLGSFSKKLTEHDIVIIIMLYTGIKIPIGDSSSSSL